MRNLAFLIPFIFCAVASAQLVQPANNTQHNSTLPSDIVIAFQDKRTALTPVTILPLLPTAQLSPGDQLQGQITIVIPTNTSVNTVGLNGFVPLVSCDPASYLGFLTVADVLQQIFVQNPVAVILYSLTNQGCTFINTPTDPISSAYHYLYTLTSRTDTNMVLSLVNMETTLYVNLERRDTYNSTGSTGSAFSASATSPTTAVAMIILYSITGVITALFLVIIVTGAVRAHRHPERYGPRAGHGRPRQSRAKGLARAMLDTLPIVKWGEDEEPADVEMASGAAAPSGVLVANKEIDHDTDTVQEAEGSNEKGTASNAASPEPIEPVEKENIGCSICTDDFERGQDVRVLPCNHQFHPACIDPWLLNVSGTCPLCRIDLRPEASRSSAAEPGPAETDAGFAPPLEQSTDQVNRRASRRQSLIWDLLNPRLMRDASPQERIAALRRVREERRASQAEEAEARRLRRLTTRLHDVFSIRTTRNRSPAASDGETSPRTGSVEAIPGSHTQSGTGNIETIHESQAENEVSTATVPASNTAIETIPEEAGPSPTPENSSTAAGSSQNKQS